MIIGAHLSVAGGIENAAKKAKAKKLTALQIFTGSPRGWREGKITPKQIEEFKKITKKAKINYVFIHAKYLTNPSSQNLDLQEKSINSLINDLNIASKIGALGVIFHPKLENEKTLIKNVKTILKNSPKSSQLILENSAQMEIEKLAMIFQKVKSKRLAFCLDTAHAFEFGYNLNDPEKLKKLIQMIKKKIGIKKLVVVHLNNSKTKYQSKHDVHADLDDGEINKNAFKTLINWPRIKNLPFVLETPSLKETSWGKTEKNINFLKSIS